VFTGSAMNTYFMSSGLNGRFAEDYIPTLIVNDKRFLEHPSLLQAQSEGTEHHDSDGLLYFSRRHQARDQVDATVEHDLQRERRPAPTPRAGVQPRQPPPQARPARRGRTLVADHATGEGREDRREGDRPRPIRDLPDGGGGGPARAVRPHLGSRGSKRLLMNGWTRILRSRRWNFINLAGVVIRLSSSTRAKNRMREFSFKPGADLRLHCTCTSSLKVLCDVRLRSNCYLVEAQYSKNISTGFCIWCGSS
jgi:hypothetical protein